MDLAAIHPNALNTDSQRRTFDMHGATHLNGSVEIATTG